MDDSLREAIADELQEDPAELTSDRSLESIPNWDSATALTIIVLVSDVLGVRVDPSEISKLQTFGDLERLVESAKK